jgi:hypothetical protein
MAKRRTTSARGLNLGTRLVSEHLPASTTFASAVGLTTGVLKGVFVTAQTVCNRRLRSVAPAGFVTQSSTRAASACAVATDDGVRFIERVTAQTVRLGPFQAATLIHTCRDRLEMVWAYTQRSPA